jgi:hypothetical protein
MNCEESKNLLNPLLDDELDVGKAADLGQHLETCLDCQNDWSGLSSLKEQSKVFRETIVIPEGMENRLRAGVEREFRSEIKTLYFPAALLVAAACALIGLLVYLNLKPPAIAQTVTVNDVIGHSNDHIVHHHGAPSVAPMSDKIGFAFKVEPMPGFQFQEADCCDLGDAHCVLAHLTYSRMVNGQEQMLSCYKMKKGMFDSSQLADASTPGLRMGRVGNLSVMLLPGGESDTVLVSSMTPDELSSLGAKLHAQTNRS